MMQLPKFRIRERGDGWFEPQFELSTGWEYWDGHDGRPKIFETLELAQNFIKEESARVRREAAAKATVAIHEVAL